VIAHDRDDVSDFRKEFHLLKRQSSIVIAAGRFRLDLPCKTIGDLESFLIVSYEVCFSHAYATLSSNAVDLLNGCTKDRHAFHTSMVNKSNITT
jgi:hypothetical protein